MRYIARFAFTATLIISAVAHGANMSVRVEQPDWYKVLSGNKSWNIVLEGVIDSGAPARVAEALRKTGSDGADIFISSPGGNLFAGMQIGRQIRKAGANTHIGTVAADPSNSFAGRMGVRQVSGPCLSACALAFLGGVYRFSTKGSQFGVHRFSSGAGPTSSDLDTAQIVAAAVGTYIREMDVDPGLFDLMVQQGKDAIGIVSTVELIRLNVINNGRKKPEWSIEVVDGAQYLRGVQESLYGRGKAVLLCHSGRMYFHSFYDAGEKAKSLASDGWYHSLLVNDSTIALTTPARGHAAGDEVATEFPLTKDQAMAIASSSSMGHAMQLARDAPTFVGYEIDIPPSASKRVGTFIRNCYTR